MSPAGHGRPVTVRLTTLWADVRSARAGLARRVLTQLVEGEPACPTGRQVDGWVEVTCPWQPSSLHRAGYPGWLRAAHLADPGGGAPTASGDRPPPGPSDAAATGPAGAALLAVCRRHVGVPYLWGGTSPRGLDCSGLVHLGMRELGRIVPRDAHDQLTACRAVPIGSARPGDLYFFGRGGAAVHHVGIVSAPGRMLHASQTGARVLEQAFDADRRETLVGAGRFTGPRPSAPLGQRATTVAPGVYDH